MKKLVLTLLFLIATHTGYSMQRLAAKFGQWCVKSIDASFMTGLHWGIAAAMPISQGIIKLLIQANPKTELRFLRKQHGILTNSSEVTKNFIEKEFSKRNTPIEKVIVTFGTDRNMSVSARYCILTKTVHDDLHDAIEECNENIKKEIIGVLNHESNHKKNKDCLTESLACLTMPLITHTTIKTLNTFFVPSSMKINSFIRACP